MIKLFFMSLLSLILLSSTMFAQSLSFHGIAVNASGQQLANQTISLRLSLLSGSASGNVVYAETQSATTNGTGAYTVEVGQGNVLSGTFATINWMSNVHFLKVEMDPAGGSHYIFVSSGQIAANASIAGTWQCGSSLTVNHIAGAVAPVNETVTYGTVTNISGETSKCWITSNLGANHQANTVNDATDASAGWYWQFNRKQGYTKVGNITPPWTITYIAEDLDWLTANDPCTSELGSGWRLPTSTEWMNVDATGNWTTWEGPWNSNLKLHAAGYLNTADGSRQNLGITGYYWSSNQFNTYSGWHLYFTSNDSWMYNMFPKALGFNVRCIKN